MLLECCGFGSFDTAEPPVHHPQVDSFDGKTLECDYDKNPTLLYQAIEEKAWGAAMEIVSPKEDFASFDSGASPVEQARTWVSRHEKDGNLRWSQLPIHAALIFGAPSELIKKLLELYPPGLKSKDDQAMLPLHLAFRYGASDDILYLLLQKYPYAINVGGYKGRPPLDCTRKDGPKHTRTLIIQAYINKTIAEMTSKLSSDEKIHIKQLEADLEAERLVVEDLARENEVLKYTATNEAFENERKKVAELERQLKVMKSANKKLAKSQVKAKNQLEGKATNGDDGSDGNAASVVAELAQAEAEAEMKKKEATTKANKGKKDKLEEMRNEDPKKEDKKSDEKKDVADKKTDEKKGDADKKTDEKKDDPVPPVETSKSNSSGSTVDTSNDASPATKEKDTPSPKMEEEASKEKKKGWSRRFSTKKKKKKEVTK